MASPEEATGCINNYKSENATIRKNVSTAKAAAKPKSEKGAAKAGAVGLCNPVCPIICSLNPMALNRKASTRPLLCFRLQPMSTAAPARQVAAGFRWHARVVLPYPTQHRNQTPRTETRFWLCTSHLGQRPVVAGFLIPQHSHAESINALRLVNLTLPLGGLSQEGSGLLTF